MTAALPAHPTSSAQPVPLGSRRVLMPAAIGFLVASIACVSVLSGPIRQLEANATGALAGWLTDGRIRAVPGIGSVLVLRDGEPILAKVTYWCSLSTVLGTLFAGAALLAWARRTPALRLVVAITAAVATVVAVNQVRLVSTTVSGYEWGNSTMSTIHDYVGTPISMLGFGIAIFLLVTWALGRRSHAPTPLPAAAPAGAASEVDEP